MAGEAIFIGYRRDDTGDVAGRVHEHFARRFGEKRIFMDVDNLSPGADFGEYIKTVLPRCRVALILIGPGWLDANDERGARRLDEPNDWVRIEIETALNTPGLDVVPVLVNGARIPRADELPPSLQPLLRRHAAIIRRNPDFNDDVARLISALRASVSSGILDLSKLGGERGASQARRGRGGRAALLTAAALLGAAVLVGTNYGWARLVGIESRSYVCSGMMIYRGQNIDRATLRLESRRWPRILWPTAWSDSQGRWEGNGSLEFPSGFRINFYDNEAYSSGVILLFSEPDGTASRQSVGSFNPNGLLNLETSELHCIAAS